jgi:hypothetical protein
VKAALNVKPHINRSYDIPYVAGDQRRSAHLYQDRRFFSDKDLDELLWLRLFSKDRGAWAYWGICSIYWACWSPTLC